MQQYSGFGADLELMACYGIVAKEKDLDFNRFQLYDHKHKYIIAVLYKPESIVLVENTTLYIIQSQEKSSVIRLDESNRFYAWYFVNNVFKKYIFDSADTIPKYVSLDVNNGNVIIYPNNLELIPETQSKIFKGLEEKAK